jgi:hypothetical protein
MNKMMLNCGRSEMGNVRLGLSRRWDGAAVSRERWGAKRHQNRVYLIPKRLRLVGEPIAR